MILNITQTRLLLTHLDICQMKRALLHPTLATIVSASEDGKQTLIVF